MLEVDFDAKELFIYDEIGPAWAGMVDDVSVVAALARLKGQDITVRINTPGGDAFMGVSIYEALRRHTGHVTTSIDGAALSAGSLIALAGDARLISRGGTVMIHNALTIAMGDGNALRKVADTLDKISGSILTIYADRLSLDEIGYTAEDVQQMMDEETWFNANEAVDFGFATEFTSASVPVPAIAENRYRKTPASMLAKRSEPWKERKRLVRRRQIRAF